MKITPGNQRATSLMHWKRSKTSTAPTLMPHVHLICHKLTSTPCLLIVENRYQRLIKPAFPLITLMSINPGVHQGKNTFIHHNQLSIHSIEPCSHRTLTTHNDFRLRPLLHACPIWSHLLWNHLFPAMPIILSLWTNTLLFISMMTLLFTIWSIIICYMKTGVYLKWTLWKKNESPLLTFEIEPTRHWTFWDDKWKEDKQAENDEPEANNIIG